MQGFAFKLPLKICHWLCCSPSRPLINDHVCCTCFVFKEILNLLGIESWDTVFISISNGLALKVELKDMAKKYPIKIDVVRNTRHAFNSQWKLSFFVST